MKRVIKAATDNIYYWNGVDKVPKDVVNVVIKDGVTGIDEYAFRLRESLQTVKIPDSVEVIGERAFDICTSLKMVEIPGSVQSIDRWAFSDCTGLETLILRDGVGYIGEEAFAYCKNLTSVNLPDSVWYIGKRAFSVCRKLSEVRLPAHADIDPSAFSLTAWSKKDQKPLTAEAEETKDIVLRALQEDDPEAEDYAEEYAEVLAKKLWRKYKAIPINVEVDDLRDVEATILDIEFETRSAKAYLLWEKDPSRGVFLDKRPAILNREI